MQYGGKEYALVADYNFLFNDPHFNSDNNYGYGKQIGGKIGVIEDPFGHAGGPRYLGATTPIVGGAVDHLTLGADGKLYADVFIEEVTSVTDRMYKSLFVWDAAELVNAAIKADERGQALTTPIDRVTGMTGQVAVPARYDGNAPDQYFGWTYGIGGYNDPALPVVLDSTKGNDPVLELLPLQPPPVPKQTIAQMFGAEDSKVLKFILKGTDLLLTGGYFERYDKRVEQYNHGKLTYDQFVQANFIDALATTTATVVTFGVAGKINIVTAGAKSLATKLVAGGAAAGAAFDATLQAGLVYVNQVTDGASGQERMSLSQILTSGALGAGLGGALTGVVKAPELFRATPALVENFFAKMGEVIGLDVSRNKQLLAREIAPEVGISPELMAAEGRSKPKLQDVSTAEVYGETQIKVGARVVATTPKAQTLTIDKAAVWYREQFNKVGSMIDKSLPLEAQIIQAQKIQQELMEGAVAAIDDPSLGNTLREAFVRPSIDKLKAEVGGAGDKQLKAVLDKLTAPDTTRKWFEPGACFAAGTLVHTKEGLKPIEQIQVGDYVLSKHDSGTGEQAYKRVLQTFFYPSETVIEVRHAEPGNPNVGNRIVCTPNHPIWVAEVRSEDDQPGWTAAGKLSNSWSGGGSKFELADGSLVRASGWLKIYATDQERVGWIPQKMGDRRDIGAIFDYGSYRVIDGKIVSYKLIAQEVLASQELRDWDLEHDHPFYEVPEHFLLKLPVYNLEVEDFHTYYVGEYGVWVHNQNCGGLSFEQQSSSVVAERVPELTTALKDNPYMSVASLRRQLELRMPTLAEREGFTETVMIRADAQSQVELIAEAEIKNWLKFEEGVSGRIKSSDGVRWEYGKVFWDPVKGEFNVIRVEGVGLSPSGNLVQNIDRKLGFVKAGDSLGMLKLLDRIAKFLENPKNANERWVFEFPPGIRKPDLVGIRKAREFFADIRNQVERFGKDGFDANGKAIWIETAEEAASNARIRKMLGEDDAHSLIELRNAGTPTIFPQNVITEGASTSIAPLTLADINALLPAARQYWLSVGASASMLNSATFQIADLPTGFAGQTQGNSITLDASGAGWGWYVDPTPAASTEFDAAVTAMDFNAPLSSEAYGKLDLLTVMIHELGHVLGMPTTVSADNVMSQYLAPGQRRLPDAVDIAALQAQGSPYFVGGTTGSPATVPTATSPSTGSVVVTNLQIPAAAFDANNWRTQGSVTNNATNTSATLAESTTSQTRLNQVFMVGPNDRYLSFTLSNVALDDQAAGPDDAFEAALLNADTGADLFGSNGLSRSDALLNLQANGTQFAAQGVTHVTNPDGSRSYVVDLAGIARNPDGSVAVNLSFDLIGFGANGSHVTVSDVRLFGQPQAADDVASGAEDAVLTIAALANDQNADLAGLAPVVVAAPAHGTVVVNADGTFSYTPQADYFGADSFTYQLSGSTGESNVATVTLSIAPVNDAPVAADLALRTAEDTATTFNLVAVDVDTDAAALAYTIQTAPQHGGLGM